MNEKFEPVAFTDVRENDRVQFVTANNGFDGGDQVWRTGTVTKVTDKSVIVDCDTNVIGKVARLRRADWHYRCVSKAVVERPTTDDVVDAPHDVYMGGILKHQGIPAAHVRKIVSNLRFQRKPFHQDGHGAICVEDRRYAPQTAQAPAATEQPAEVDPVTPVTVVLNRMRAKADAERAAYRAQTDDQIAAECAEHGVRAPAGVTTRISARKAAEGAEAAPEGCGAVDAGELDACGQCADCTPQAGAELARRVLEGTVVTHDGTAQGSAPSDATHPDVVAARETLRGFVAATMTEDHDTSDPKGHEQNVRGYVISPRGHGRVAVYWLENGRMVRRGDARHGRSLNEMAERLACSGWTVEPMLRTASQCVFAVRPQADPKPADQPKAAPVHVYRADHTGCEVNLLRNATEADARERCEEMERRSWPTGTTLVFGWIEDEENGIAELVVTAGQNEESTTGYIVTADPQPAPAPEPPAIEATAPEEAPAAPELPLTVAQARAAVAREYPGASKFEPYRGQGGTFLGYTFQVGQLHSARYGWITTSGTYSKGLEPYRSTAADVLFYADREEQERAEVAEAARHGCTVKLYRALLAQGALTAPEATGEDNVTPNTGRMTSDTLLAGLRAVMQDVPADSLTRQMWEELDNRMCEGTDAPADWF